ncbi:MAG TPA: iron-sulfur cluster assembly scaffold protein [candidate division WWE3 bacterium]|uniref:Iron-sulfur cluster assembly scaffold protein n=1 Tax=candidate division WWE3 bacterium TaxID=2053526 RepID=A0A7C1SV62_UNCKA|nr:iron-sulfur cluster assembly scaffold protein [candidate division WWE3 bacterium]
MDLYREEILEHAKNPKNWGEMENPTVKVQTPNPLCGDVIDLFLKLEGDPPKITEASFKTNGCVVSVASSSMLTEAIKGKKASNALKLGEDDVLSWFGGTLTSSRRDCALLPLKALKEILGKAIIVG